MIGRLALRAVDELAEPELEHHHGPQPVLVIRAAGAMILPQLLHAVVAHDAASGEAAAEQHVVAELLQRPREPLIDRRGEPLLRALEDRRRHRLGDPGDVARRVGVPERVGDREAVDDVAEPGEEDDADPFAAPIGGRGGDERGHPAT
jgi:hypothetical protein